MACVGNRVGVVRWVIAQVPGESVVKWRVGGVGEGEEWDAYIRIGGV